MGATIHTIQSFRDLLQQERARVQRRGRQFSLILLQLPEKASLSKGVLPVMLPALLKRIRKIDKVGLYDENHIGLLLPHTPGDGARKLAGDLYRMQTFATNIVECAFYSYP